MHQSTLFNTLVKEPLIHFLLIGLGLFFFYAQVNNKEDSNAKQKIIIQNATLTALTITFEEENSKKATEEDKKNILENYIREEVLYREAMAMDLDKNDKVIRHRLSEKISYLFEDISILEDPSEKTLKAYFKANPNKFKSDAKYKNIKEEIQEAWIASEQAKENKAFYENLKSRYQILREEK